MPRTPFHSSGSGRRGRWATRNDNRRAMARLGGSMVRALGIIPSALKLDSVLKKSVAATATDLVRRLRAIAVPFGTSPWREPGWHCVGAGTSPCPTVDPCPRRCQSRSHSESCDRIPCTIPPRCPQRPRKSRIRAPCTSRGWLRGAPRTKNRDRTPCTISHHAAHRCRGARVLSGPHAPVAASSADPHARNRVPILHASFRAAIRGAAPRPTIGAPAPWH